MLQKSVQNLSKKFLMPISKCNCWKGSWCKGNQTNGKLESGFNINVRGSASISAGTSPLYVIDGIPMINSDESTNGAPVNPWLR
jgi:hypothetical protein